MTAKIYIDKLELAFERDTTFEKQLQVSNDQKGQILSNDWAFEVEGSLVPVPDDIPLDDLLNGEYVPMGTDGYNSDNSITIGKWCFVKGCFPGPNTPYKYNYRVEYLEPNGGYSILGHIYYQTYLLRRDKLYLRIANYALYDESFWELIQLFEHDFGLRFLHVSKVDIALDSPVNTSKVVYDLMKRDKSIEWVINGHRVIDRNITVKKLFWTVSGTIENPDLNRSLYISQTEGLTLNCYDKTVEIEAKSNKYYQTGDWDMENDGVKENDAIYRSETRMSRKDVINYTESHGINEVQFRGELQNLETRFEIFRNLSRKLIRWNKEGRSRDITTLVMPEYNNSVLKR